MQSEDFFNSPVCPPASNKWVRWSSRQHKQKECDKNWARAARVAVQCTEYVRAKKQTKKKKRITEIHIQQAKQKKDAQRVRRRVRSLSRAPKEVPAHRSAARVAASAAKAKAKAKAKVNAKMRRTRKMPQKTLRLAKETRDQRV
jgi:hypothetical protein